ncbi:MAG: RDD family protein [Chloroflexota bacterium]
MVRCMRCGDSVEGFSQLCDKCGAEKKAADEASKAHAAIPATMPCPWCQSTMLMSAARCPACFREPSDFRPGVHGAAAGSGMGLQRADFWVRLVAALIDGLILIVPNVALRIAFGTAGIGLSLLVGVSYSVWFWTQKGATPGKMAMGLKVVDNDGRLLTPMHAVGRYFSYFLNAITLGIGYLMIFGEEHKGLHDRVSGSQVVFARTLPHPVATQETQPAA